MKKDPQIEKKIGETVKSRLESALKSEISSFKPNTTQEKNREDLKNLNIRVDGRNWKGKQGDNLFFIDKFALEMSIHGFVQHYGVDSSTRSTGIRKRHYVGGKQGEFLGYWRGEHKYNVEPTEFISTALEKSNVIPYLLREITIARGQRVFVGMSTYFNEATRKHIK